MPWKTYRFYCADCDADWDNLFQLDSDAPLPESDQCPECGATGPRIPAFGGTTRASYVDGHRRFDDIRARRKVEKELKRARRRQDRDSIKRLSSELNKVKGS